MAKTIACRYVVLPLRRLKVRPVEATQHVQRNYECIRSARPPLSLSNHLVGAASVQSQRIKPHWAQALPGKAVNVLSKNQLSADCQLLGWTVGVPVNCTVHRYILPRCSRRVCPAVASCASSCSCGASGAPQPDCVDVIPIKVSDSPGLTGPNVTPARRVGRYVQVHLFGAR